MPPAFKPISKPRLHPERRLGLDLPLSQEIQSSPARAAPLADELKVVVFNKSDFAWAEQYATQTSPSCKLYLQPEWSKAADMTPLIVDYIKDNTGAKPATAQVHQCALTPSFSHLHIFTFPVSALSTHSYLSKNNFYFRPMKFICTILMVFIVIVILPTL